MADHATSETQKVSVSQSGGANNCTISKRCAPCRAKHTGQANDDSHATVAGEGRATAATQPKIRSPAPSETLADADRASPSTQTRYLSPDPHDESSQEGRGAMCGSLPKTSTPRARNGGQEQPEVHSPIAPEIGEAGHCSVGTQLTDARFVDPLVVQIREQWRLRQDMVRAMSRLTLQAKAILRRMCEGDKDEADKLYASLSNGKDHSLAGAAMVAVAPLLMAREPLEVTRKLLEKRLAKLAKGLPIAHMVEEIKGFGYVGLASIVGECGDLSAFKSVAAVHKYCGLAVIRGERQRKKSGDAAIEQGYNPQLRAVIWVLQDPLFRAQSRGVNDGAVVGPYRAAYDIYKAAQLLKIVEYPIKDSSKTEMLPMKLGHAHNRALRKMAKDLLRDLTVAWRRAGRARSPSQPTHQAPGPLNESIAAE